MLRPHWLAAPNGGGSPPIGLVVEVEWIDGLSLQGVVLQISVWEFGYPGLTLCWHGQVGHEDPGSLSIGAVRWLVVLLRRGGLATATAVDFRIICIIRGAASIMIAVPMPAKMVVSVRS